MGSGWRRGARAPVEDAVCVVEPFPGVFSAAIGGAVHGFDHEVEGGVGAVAAFIVVACFGELAGGEEQYDLSWLDAVGGEDGDAIEVGGFAPAVDTVADEDGADFEEAGLVEIPETVPQAGMGFSGLVVAGELDGFIESQAFVARHDLERVAGEDFVAELALEAVDDAGVGREVEIEDPGSGLDFDAEEDRAEVEGGFPVGGAVNAMTQGTAVKEQVDALLGHEAELMAFCRPGSITEAMAQDLAGAVFAGAVVEEHDLKN